MNINYYLFASYRRKILDKLQAKYASLYHGVVLDIGGRDRGRFKKPKGKTEKWVFVDIQANHNPDIVADVADMTAIGSCSVDVVSAIELFEHVEKIEKGLRECFRILKPGGKMLLSVPFMYPVHADPSDFQRWTNYKWEKELASAGFEIVQIEIMGRIFTLLADISKTIVRRLPFGLRHLAYFLFPLFDLLTKIDNTKVVTKHKKLSNFHGGYFIIINKSQNCNQKNIS